MSDIKFSCESCGQPILVDAKDAGRKLACPNCKLQLTVPKQSRPAQEGAPQKRVSRPASQAVNSAGEGLPPPTAAAQTMEVSAMLRLKKPQEPTTPSPRLVEPADPIAPGKASEVGPAPATGEEPPMKGASTPPALKVSSNTAPTPVPKPPEPSQGSPEIAQESTAQAPAQVAVLTAEVKRDIVRSVREFLTDPARWMPGVDENGRPAYAVGQDASGTLTRVDVESEAAVQFSLMGAVVRELHRRNVAPTARGRLEFLDQEIPGGLRQALGVESGAKEEKPPEAMDPRILGASHAQCLKALELLEAEHANASMAESTVRMPGEVGGESLEELLVRSTRDEVVTTVQVLKALHREFTQLRRRIGKLESALGSDARQSM